MVKKIRDIGFSITLIFLIAIGAYWIMEQLQKDYLDQYINILGDKLIALVPESSEKRALSGLFDQFRTKVDNREISPEQVEQIAAEIFNLSNLSDSISFAEAEELISLPETTPVVNIPELDSKKWRDLEARLENIYKFEEKVRFVPEIRFQVDNKLNILIDKNIKHLMQEAKNRHLIVEIENLEKNDAVIWMNSLDSNLVNRKKQLIQIRLNEELAKSEKLHEIHEMLNIKADSIEAVIALHQDSIRIDVKRAKPTLPEPRD